MDDSTVAAFNASWELFRASSVNVYMTFADRELTEPSTVFGPNVAKAIWLLGELLGATVILYEVAPENLVHFRIALFVVTENTDTCKADERGQDWRSAFVYNLAHRCMK